MINVTPESILSFYNLLLVPQRFKEKMEAEGYWKMGQKVHKVWQLLDNI